MDTKSASEALYSETVLTLKSLKPDADYSRLELVNYPHKENVSITNPVLSNPLESLVLEPCFDTFIKTIPDDANRNLLVELAFAELLLRFEKLPTLQLEPEESFTVRSTYYCILLDLALFCINNKNAAQNDLAFILLGRVISYNSFEFLTRFWPFLESRKAAFLEFLKPELYPEGLRSRHTVHNRLLVARRRPGTLFLKNVRQLVQKASVGRESVANDTDALLGNIYVFLAQCFLINDDMLADTTFTFDERYVSSFTHQLKKNTRHNLHWTAKLFYQNPTRKALGLGPLRLPAELRTHKIFLEELTMGKVFPRDKEDPKNTLTKTALLYNGSEASYVGTSSYLQLLADSKKSHFQAPDRSKYSLVAPRTEFDVFEDVKNDPRYCAASLVQVYLGSKLFLLLTEQAKQAQQTRLEAMYLRLREIASEEVFSVPPLSQAKDVYPTVQAERKMELEHFEETSRVAERHLEKDHGLSGAADLISKSDEVWFGWKIGRYGVFNILANEETYSKKSEIARKRIEEAKEYERPFGIAFGNRNVTKIFNKERDLKSGEPSSTNLADLAGLKAKWEAGEMDDEDFVTASWKTARFGGEFSDPELYNVTRQKEGSKEKNAGLKRRLAELEMENRSLEEQVDKKMKSTYVSVSGDQNEDGDENGDASEESGDHPQQPEVSEALEY